MKRAGKILPKNLEQEKINFLLSLLRWRSCPVNRQVLFGLKIQCSKRITSEYPNPPGVHSTVLTKPAIQCDFFFGSGDNFHQQNVFSIACGSLNIIPQVLRYGFLNRYVSAHPISTLLSPGGYHDATRKNHIDNR